MYIWTAIDIDNQLNNILPTAKEIEQNLAFKNSAFTLPFHISLKISFWIEDSDYLSVIKTLTAYYKTLSPFEIKIKGIEIENNIVWIKMDENGALNKIHNELDQLLMQKHGVSRHAFDLDFKFHTTLFLDDDSNKILTAFNQIKNLKLPSSLRANKFIIGSSKTGKIGSYKVTNSVDLSP